MKKLLLIICILTLFFGSNVFAQSWVEDVYLYEDYTSATGSWVDGTAVYGNATGITTGSGNTFSSTINTTNKNVEIKTKVYDKTFIKNVKTFSGTGTPYTSPSGKLTISFICKIGSGQTYSGGYYYFRDNTNKPIFGLGFARINANGSNQWYAVRLPSYVEWVDAAASYPNIADRILLFGTTVISSPALKVTAVLDFNAHTVELTTIAGTYTPNGTPEWVDGTPTYTSSPALPFLDNTASNISNMIFNANGAGNSSVSTATNFTFDNFKIAGEKESAGFGNVTVKYVDADGNSLSSVKPDVSHTGLIAGSTYTASDVEKADFNDGSYYYVYDASISTDNALVVLNTTTDLTLKFKKYPLITNSNLTWTGLVNGTWNYLTGNFTSDGSNSIGYQNLNGVNFPAEPTNKTVSLNAPVDLGTGNLTFTGTGYSLTTGVLGSISGTGSLNINLSNADVLTLNAVNNLAGVTQIAGGNVTVSKTGSLGTGVNITGASTLTFGVAGVTIPATTFGASSSLVAGAINSSLISGMSAADGIKISVSAAMNHGNNDTSRAFDFAPNGTLAAGSELELNGIGTDNRIGMTAASTDYLINTKVSLKGAAMLYINASHEDGAIINIGTLAGEAGSKLGWGRASDVVRALNWSVGSSNQNSEFAGSITNTGGYKGSGSSYVGNFTHFIKEGSATLILSGTANTHNGNFTVNNGTLNVTGAIGNATSVITVNTNGILKGTGTIGGPVTINGTLEGNLHFGSTLVLAGTTNLTVTDIEAAQFDVLNVTGAVTNGGILNINLLKEPTGSGTIKLIAAPDGAYSGTFTAVNITTPSTPSGVPAARRAKTAIGYSYDPSTGVLSYTDLGTGISELNNAAEIYPTLTRGEVYVNAENAATVHVLSLGGQLMKQLKTSGTRTTLNLKGLADGAYLVKVRYTDGTDKTQQVILRR